MEFPEFHAQRGVLSSLLATKPCSMRNWMTVLTSNGRNSWRLIEGWSLGFLINSLQVSKSLMDSAARGHLVFTNQNHGQMQGRGLKYSAGGGVGFFFSDE